MNKNEIIKKSDGKPFKTVGNAKNALRMKGLNYDAYTIEPQDGGFVCIPIKNNMHEPQMSSTEEKPKDPPVIAKSKPNVKRVRVHRASGSPENKDTQISVCVNNPRNRKKFFPGEEVELTPSEIGVLRNSVEENVLYIPPDSGIYSAAEPLAIARNQYPGMSAQYDHVTGQIKMVKRTPNYLIEEVMNA